MPDAAVRSASLTSMALAMQTLWGLHVLLCPEARIVAHLAAVAAQKLRDACIAERGGWRLWTLGNLLIQTALAPYLHMACQGT